MDNLLDIIPAWAYPIGFIVEKEQICPNCKSKFLIRGTLRVGGPEIQEVYCPVCSQKIWVSAWGRKWTSGNVIYRGPEPVPPAIPVSAPPDVILPPEKKERLAYVTCKTCGSLLAAEGYEDPNAEDIQELICPVCGASVFLKRGFIRTTWTKLTPQREPPPKPFLPNWAKTVIIGAAAVTAVYLLIKKL